MGTIPGLPPRVDDLDSRDNNIVVAASRRVFILVTHDPRHLPPVALLRALHGGARHGTGRLQRQQCHCQHRRRCASAGPRGLLRHLREPRRWLLVVQQQCDDAGERGLGRPGPPQPHLAGQPIQGHDRVSLPHHHRNHLCLHLPPPPSHLSRLARGRGQRRVRARGQALPVAPRQPGGAGHHLHRLHLCASLGPLAAHGLGRGQHHCPGPRQRQRAVRRRQLRHGHGLVQLHAAHHRHHWPAGHDIEHGRAAAYHGLMGLRSGGGGSDVRTYIRRGCGETGEGRLFFYLLRLRCAYISWLA